MRVGRIQHPKQFGRADDSGEGVRVLGGDRVKKGLLRRVPLR